MKKTTAKKRKPAPRKPGRSLDALAEMGRFGDSEVGHLTPGEVVVPKRVMQNDPALRHHASMAMARAGFDPDQYVVGHPRNSRNPETGAREFAAQMVSDPINGTYWYDPSTGSTSFTNPGQQQEAPNDPNASGSSRTPNAMSAGQRNWGSQPNQQVNQQLAQATGFSGDFGSGGFSSYMAGATPEQQAAAANVLNSAGQGNRIDWNTGLTAPVDEPNDPNASGGPKTPGTIYGASNNGNRNWGAAPNAQANQGLANLTGYTGDFGGGAFNNWLYSQPNRNELESQVGQYLFANGQADRANMYAWDRNGNGAVEGTEAAGVIDNGDGTYVFPGGYERGRAIDPFTPGKNIYQINPNIPGAPPAYEWGTAPDGMMPAGAWPETMMDPIRGTTTYWSAPPPGADGQWNNSNFLPWDVRNGGTGDPYVPWTEEWARKQAAAGNGYAAQALQGAGVDLASMAPNGNIGALTSGQGASNAAGFDRGWQAQGFYQTKDGVYQTMDGVLVIPQGNGLFLDTMYGFYRNAQGIIVDANGQPIITQYNAHTGQGSSDPWRVFGSSGAMAMIGQFAGVDLGSLNDGNNTPIVGNYGGGTPTPIRQTFQGRDIVRDIRGDPWAQSVYNRATGSLGGPAGAAGGGAPPSGGNQYTYPTGGTQNTGGTNTNTGTNGQTQTGTGLVPGTVNPYSFLLPYLMGMGGGVNINLGGNSSTPLTPNPNDPLGLFSAGYYMTPGGYPLYTSSNGEDEEGGGIDPITSNRQTVDFRSPFAYL